MKNTTYIKGFGNVEGVPAGQLTVGSVIFLNYGFRYKIVSLEPTKTGKQIKTIIEELEGHDSLHVGARYEQRFATNRIVAIDYIA